MKLHPLSLQASCTFQPAVGTAAQAGGKSLKIIIASNSKKINR